MQVIYKVEEHHYYVVRVMILISFCKHELKYKNFVLKDSLVVTQELH